MRNNYSIYSFIHFIRKIIITGLLYFSVFTHLQSSSLFNFYETKNLNKISQEMDTSKSNYPFLEIVAIEVKNNSDSISAFITLRKIADSISINKSFIEKGHPEYSWTLAFDLLNDSNFRNNIYAELSYSNLSSAFKTDASIGFKDFLSICNKSVNLISAKGVAISSFNILEVTQTKNTLIFCFPKNKLPDSVQIDNMTPWLFETCNDPARIDSSFFHDYYSTSLQNFPNIKKK